MIGISKGWDYVPIIAGGMPDRAVLARKAAALHHRRELEPMPLNANGLGAGGLSHGHHDPLRLLRRAPADGRAGRLLPRRSPRWRRSSIWASRRVVVFQQMSTGMNAFACWRSRSSSIPAT